MPPKKKKGSLAAAPVLITMNVHETRQRGAAAAATQSSRCQLSPYVSVFVSS
eukprot:COSAG01_NODE_23_length_37704_cov_30.005877_27_plen_52_part_00